MQEISSQACSFIAVLGAPNAGKSTLVNYVVGAKVSIVTPKVQTTRTLIRGICMEGNSQLVFIDTPGIFKPAKQLEKKMVRTAWDSTLEADKMLLVIDAKKGLTGQVAHIIAGLRNAKTPIILVLNKIDLVPAETLLALSKSIYDMLPIEQVFMISARKGSGVADLRAYLGKTALPGPWHYDPEDITDIPEKFLAAEITRETLFLALNQEIPYALTVCTESWEQKDENSVTIRQVILIEKESQKRIVVGQGGQLIKHIGSRSRQQLEKVLGKKVHLFLFVKVDPKWFGDPLTFQHRL